MIVEEKNWAKFCGVIESKTEIQRLFQFLAYSFIFNYTKEKDEREYKKNRINYTKTNKFKL